MKLTETTVYDLEESYVSPTFELKINKEIVNSSFLVYLGGNFAYNNINVIVEETDTFIKLKLCNGCSITGNFTESVNKLKQQIVRIITELSTKYSLNLEIDLIKTKTLNDVFEAKKSYALNCLKNLKEEDFFIFGNPEHFLEKNTDFTTLSIRLGKLFYSDNFYKDGFLGKTLKSFSEKHNLICRAKERNFFKITEIELLDLIDVLEPK